VSRNRIEIANVDDSLAARLGVTSLIARFLPDATVTEFSHAEALGKADWSGFDYAVLDLAYARDSDSTIDEYPAVQIASQIKDSALDRGPWVIVVTSFRDSFAQALVRRRLVEAGVTCFVFRDDLGVTISLDDLFTSSGPGPGVVRLDPNAIEVVEPGLGVTRGSRLNVLVASIPGSRILTTKLKGGVSDKVRSTLQALGGIRQISASGQEKPGTPDAAQFNDIFTDSARIPRSSTTVGRRRRGNEVRLPDAETRRRTQGHLDQ